MTFQLLGSLPDDVFTHLVCEWVVGCSLKDLRALDAAICDSTLREKYLRSIQRGILKASFNPKSERSLQQLETWLYRRRIMQLYVSNMYLHKGSDIIHKFEVLLNKHLHLFSVLKINDFRIWYDKDMSNPLSSLIPRNLLNNEIVSIKTINIMNMNGHVHFAKSLSFLVSNPTNTIGFHHYVLENLILSGLKDTESHWKTFFEKFLDDFSHRRELKLFSLYHCDGTGLEAVTKVLLACRNLSILEFGCTIWQDTEPGITQYTQQISTAPKFTCLKTLLLTSPGPRMMVESAYHKAFWIEVWKHCVHLERLDLTNFHFTAEERQRICFEVIPTCWQRLTALNPTNGAFLSPGILQSLQLYCPLLRDLKISNDTCLSDEEEEGGGLWLAHMTTLQILHLVQSKSFRLQGLFKSIEKHNNDHTTTAAAAAAVTKNVWEGLQDVELICCYLPRLSDWMQLLSSLHQIIKLEIMDIECYHSSNTTYCCVIHKQILSLLMGGQSRYYTLYLPHLESITFSSGPHHWHQIQDELLHRQLDHRAAATATASPWSSLSSFFHPNTSTTSSSSSNEKGNTEKEQRSSSDCKELDYFASWTFDPVPQLKTLYLIHVPLPLTTIKRLVTKCPQCKCIYVDYTSSTTTTKSSNSSNYLYMTLSSSFTVEQRVAEVEKQCREKKWKF